MKAFRGGALSLAVALLCPALARAQASGDAGLSIAPGTELRLIRLATPEPVLRGKVVRLAGDTILLLDGDVTTRTTVSELIALEVRGGEDKRRGFLVGVGAATLITGIAGGIDASKGTLSGADFAGLMIGNALIGGLVGYVFAPTGWERIPLPTRGSK